MMYSKVLSAKYQGSKNGKDKMLIRNLKNSFNAALFSFIVVESVGNGEVEF